MMIAEAESTVPEKAGRNIAIAGAIVGDLTIVGLRFARPYGRSTQRRPTGRLCVVVCMHALPPTSDRPIACLGTVARLLKVPVCVTGSRILILHTRIVLPGVTSPRLKLD